MILDLTIVDVCPGVVGLDGEAGVVEDREPVHDVGAELRVHILRPVLAETRPVPRPVGEVAHNLTNGSSLTSFLNHLVHFIPCSLQTIPEVLLDNSR